jgi:transposase
VVIGYEVGEQLDLEPLKYFGQVTEREKRACIQCEEQGVATAPVPARIIEESLVSDQIVIDTIVRKYCDSLPLYRQSVMLKPFPKKGPGLPLGRINRGQTLEMCSYLTYRYFLKGT